MENGGVVIQNRPRPLMYTFFLWCSSPSQA